MASFLLLFLFLFATSALSQDSLIGVNIGTEVTNMPSPTEVVTLLKSQNINRVRLYDADRSMLLAFAHTGIEVIISVPNEQLLGISQSNATAANWVTRNVAAYYPATNITAIAVGSEVLTTVSNVASVLVSALKYIQSALVTANLDRQIKVSTPHSSTIILDSFPPSQAFFNKTWDPVIVPLLKFLQSTGSPLMLNVYPYFDYVQSNGAIPLDYALFQPFAMSYLNFTNIPIVVTESGWPSKGDGPEHDATLENANTYNSNLIQHVINKTGTPKHPGTAVATYIYELYNEDTRPGPVSEKNWGLFFTNGTPVYTLRLAGAGAILANDTTNQTFCIAKEKVDKKMLQAALDWACGPGKVDCSALMQGEACYEPDDVVAHSSYAFNAYYQKMGKASGSCDFKGVATVTSTDPSRGTCVFPGSAKSNQTLGNTTMASAPSANSSTSGCIPQYYRPHASIPDLTFLSLLLLIALVFL